MPDTYDDRLPLVDDQALSSNPIDNRPSAPADETRNIAIRRPGDKEIATLEVRGDLFTNWTSVRVEQKVTQAFPTFQFECTEESPVPLATSELQFVPGDIVRVYVGGVSAVFGYITERHVGYDATNHGVRLIGCGDTIDLTNSSVPLEKISGHDGKNWLQIAKDISDHLKIAIIPMGAVDLKPFDNVHVQPGETPMQVMERYARMRNIVIGSNANGGLLAIGEHSAVPQGGLTEGYNILRANCVVRDEMVYKRIFAVGQDKSGDNQNGDQSNKLVAFRPGTSTRNRYQVVPTDIADGQHGVERRADMEVVFTEGSRIEAHITVQGWFKDNNQSDEVWRAGEYYTVNSPSLILFDVVLGCAGCTYEQSNAGTTTTLEMVDPRHMNGRLNFRKEQEEYNKLKRAEDAAKAAAAQAEKDKAK